MRLPRYTALALIPVFGIAAAPLYHYSQGHLSPNPLPTGQKADGVIVFTGSTNRVEQGYTLHLAETSAKLMISGKDYASDEQQPVVMALAGKADKSKVFIDKVAKTTIENARNSAEWIEAEELKTVILLTSKKHMPRAYFELRRLLPRGVTLYTSTVSGNLNYPGLDSEQSRLACRIYETVIGLSFCYEMRNQARSLGL